MTLPILALPGFLGLPSDWEKFKLSRLRPIDLNNFHTQLAEFAALRCILMGYSFGGRLALQTLISYPDRFQGAVIVSAHPGLATEKERLERINLDEVWADRFEKEEWQSLMDSWNSRPVFSTGGHHFDRKEGDYDRKKLADMLRWGSLGRQKDLRDEIAKLKLPILWVTGEKDEQYSDLARRLKFQNEHSRHVVMGGCGHRCPWEKPDEFIRLVEQH